MASHDESLLELFKSAKEAISSRLPKDTWYILLAAALLSTDGGTHLRILYQFVLSDLGPDSTLENRQQVSRKLRAVIIKSWPLIGMPRASEGLFSLLQTEEPSDAAQDWNRFELVLEPDKAVANAHAWWLQVFGEVEARRISKSYETNPDFAWTVEYVVYGLFLSDLSVLGPVENELVILASVMGQGAQNTTRFHLRGTRRIGVGAEDAELVQAVIRMVALHQGKDTSSWPRFKEVEHLFL